MRPARDAVLLTARRLGMKALRRSDLLSALLSFLAWTVFLGLLVKGFRLNALPPAPTYLEFAAPGLTAALVFLGASRSGADWIPDLRTGFLPRLLRTPASPQTLLAGKLLADGVPWLGQGLLILLLASLVGGRFSPSWPAVAIAFLGLAALAVAAAGLSGVVAFRRRTRGAVLAFARLAGLPILFTSTALVPAEQMPDVLRTIARWNPLSWCAEGLRGALLDGEIPSLIELSILIGLAVGLYALAAREMARLGKLD